MSSHHALAAVLFSATVHGGAVALLLDAKGAARAGRAPPVEVALIAPRALALVRGGAPRMPAETTPGRSLAAPRAVQDARPLPKQHPPSKAPAPLVHDSPAAGAPAAPARSVDDTMASDTGAATSESGGRANTLATGSGEGAAAGVGGDSAAVPGPDTRALERALRRSAVGCYPAQARRLLQTGAVQLRFCLDERGELLSAEREKSSGFNMLDDAALGCVLRGALPQRGLPGCYSVAVAFDGDSP